MVVDMFVIGVYDISTVDKPGRRRLNKIKDLMRRYLHHTQKSVFEGEITEGQLLELKKLVMKLIDEEEDYVVFYKVSSVKNIERENLGIDFDPTDVFV